MYAGRKGVACQEACGTMDQLEIFEKGRTLRNGYRVSQRRSLHLLITRSEGKKSL